MSNEPAESRTQDDSLCILWDGVAPHIRYLCAVYRDECSRGVVRCKPDEIIERLGPRSREGFCRALQHVMVDHPRRCKCREGGKEDNYAAQHVGGRGGEGMGKWRTRAALVIPLTYKRVMLCQPEEPQTLKRDKTELHTIPRSREGTGPKTFSLVLREGTRKSDRDRRNARVDSVFSYLGGMITIPRRKLIMVRKCTRARYISVCYIWTFLRNETNCTAH